jgi:hypothetical protein
MNIRKQVKKLGVLTAIGAATVMSSTAVNAAVLTFAEGDQVIDSAVTSNFSLTLVADGLIADSFGGGLLLTFNQSVVNITGSTIDSYWNIVNTNGPADNANGTFEFRIGSFFSGPANTVSQNILTLDFSVVGDGAFDFGFQSLGAVGDWAYTPPLVPVGEGDKTYCLTTDFSAPTTCIDSIADSTGRELLTLSSTNVTVASTVVPVPAAVWLFGSGLIGLVGISRRKAA